MDNKVYIYIPIELLYYNISSTSKLLYGLLYKETYKGHKGYEKDFKNLAITLDTTTRTIYNCIKELKENKLVETFITIEKKKTITINLPEYKEPKTIQDLFRRIK